MSRHEEGTRARLFWRRAYRMLLPLLPGGLRARHGDAMLELFDRELGRRERDGTGAVWVAGMTGLADLVRRGVHERLCHERRAMTSANVTMLRHTARTFVVTSVALTALLVARGALTQSTPLRSGTVFDALLFSIPYTAALTIPMSVFVAVLWAASRRPGAARREDGGPVAGTVRLAPLVGMASAVALCCLALNTELVPRANLRLQAMYAGQVTVTPGDRSMTLRQLRQAAVNSAGATRTSYEVEIQKKLALAAACVALTLLAVGIARRTSRLGVGAQAAVSLVVFGGYYVCIIAGERLADQSAVSPALAMWSGNIVVLVLAMLSSARHVRRMPPMPSTS